VYGNSRRNRLLKNTKSMVRDEEWKHLDVNEHWHKMKKIMMETAQHIWGMSKGPCRHKEAWWWNEEVAEAVSENKIKVQKMEQRKLKGGMDGV